MSARAESINLMGAKNKGGRNQELITIQIDGYQDLAGVDLNLIAQN
jgi:hypothetical protein